jgi:hypothetical protein
MKAKATTPKHAERKHSRISPSVLKPLQICPGYESDPTESEASLRGTRLHEVIESGSLEGIEDPEDRVAAQTVFDILTTAELESPFEPLKELELDFTPLKIPDFEKGHADRVIILDVDKNDDPTAAELIDFKFGKGEVDPPKSNIQFRAYSLGLFVTMPTLERVRVRLIQPALNINETAEFTRARDFEMIVTQVNAIAKRRAKWLETQDKTMLKPDELYCSYCAAQATCPMWQEYMVRLANQANLFGHTIMPLETLDSLENADPNELIAALRWIKPMQDYLKKFKQFALQVYDAGKISEGLKLIEKPGDSTIVDPIRVGEILDEECGISTEEFIALCQPSITKIKARISEAAEHGQKSKEVDRVFKKITDEGLIQAGTLVRYVQLSKSKAK